MAKKSKGVAVPMKFDESRWRAEEDARTLAEAESIKKDPKRMAKAAKRAGQMAKEKMDQANAMKRVARRAK